MELYIKGKFSNKERFEIYDEMKSVRYMVMAEFGFGHKIHIYDAYDKEIGYLESYTEKLMTQYRLYDEDGYIDSLLHKFSFKKSQYRLEKLNWKISATNFWETHFDFTCDGEKIGEISCDSRILKEGYYVRVEYENDELLALMITMAIACDKADAAAAAAAA
ncbi:MAG: hypothetical protein IKX74_05845 [Erysipelotrichaceae bacterium]|nr:hypothetical protein [Erysipelotrichaceae bacterium]MBO4537549.1 hypothetical protein [Erysipelotrichaceae bacterium]MBR5049142.1 hypothetical protein [Erysipelotrichaceae bacterium]